jgi:hypothetical protein
MSQVGALAANAKDPAKSYPAGIALAVFTVGAAYAWPVLWGYAAGEKAPCRGTPQLSAGGFGFKPHEAQGLRLSASLFLQQACCEMLTHV